MNRLDQSRRDGDLIDIVEDAATAIGRLSYGLLRLPLAFLPTQSRRHMDNALRELSYAFVRLPADFAKVAEREIEDWIGDEAPSMRTPRSKTKRNSATAVDLSPLVVERSADDLPDLATLAPPTRTDPLEAIPTPTDADLGGALTAPERDTIIIVHIEFDPPGRDLSGEYVHIRNTGTQMIDLQGWRLQDGGSKHIYIFPAFRLAAGAEVKLWTKQGSDDDANLYWKKTNPIWNNNGDSGTLIDAEGNIMFQYSYDGNP